MKRLKMATWLALLLLAELVPARPDMILKVPKVRHEVVPRPVGTRSTFDATPTNTTDDDEFFEQTTKSYVEHEVTLNDARKAIKSMKIFWMTETLPGCGKCSREAMEYCESQMLDDHCCCERSYHPEPFSWVPHVCLIGPERCIIHAPNCAQYTRLRDCCCNKKLAEKWTTILSRASQLSMKGMSFLFIAMVLFSLYI